jgi:hypothetical protein
VGPHSYRMNSSPHKKPRHVINLSSTPVRYTTPPQHIPEPILPYKNRRPSSGSYHFTSRPVHRSPTPGYGSGFSFEPEWQTPRFERRIQPSISPVPFRCSSNFEAAVRPGHSVGLRSNAQIRKGVDPFETPRRMAILPVNLPHLARTAYPYALDPSNRAYTPSRSGLDTFATSPHRHQDSEHVILPFSLPYRRNQSCTDFGRKAAAMAFQPSMPVIAEESEFGEASAVKLYSEPRTISPPPIWWDRPKAFALMIRATHTLSELKRPSRSDLLPTDITTPGKRDRMQP